jgi:hypothetical protein
MPAKGSTRGVKRTTNPVVLSSSPIKRRTTENLIDHFLLHRFFSPTQLKKKMKERQNYYLFGFCFISKIPSNK